MATQHEECAKAIQALQRGLAVAESPRPTLNYLKTEDFDMEPDHIVLTILLAEAAAFEMVKELTESLLQRPHLTTTAADLIGSTLAKDFVFQFEGDAVSIAKKARKVGFSGRRSSGAWEEFTVTTPASGPTRAYLNFDKSDRQIRTESICKKMDKILKELLPGQKIRSRRYTEEKVAQISVKDTPIVRLSVEYGKPPIVLWNNEGVAKQNIPREQIMEAFKAQTESNPAVEWTCL